MPLMRESDTRTLVITSGQTTSSAAEIANFGLFGMILPSTYDGTAMTFEVSADGTNWFALYDNLGVQVSLTVAASRAFDLPLALASFPYFRVVAGTAQSGTDTSITVVLKG